MSGPASTLEPFAAYLARFPAAQRRLFAACVHPLDDPACGWREFPPPALAGTISARFAHIVAQFPDRLALADTGPTGAPRQLTYAELDAWAEHIAHAILAQRPPGSEPVAILCTHSLVAIVAMFGVLKAGKFYLLLDTVNPHDHNRRIIAESEAPLLLICGDLPSDDPALAGLNALTAAMPASDAKTIHLAPTPPAVPTESRIQDPKPIIQESSLAYITFTTGTTGHPKGVIEDHQDVLHFTWLFSNHFHISPRDRATLINRISSGGAGVNIYPTLLNGAALHLFDARREGGPRLAHWLAEHQITYASMTVSLFRQCAPALSGPHALPALRYLAIGGEPVLPGDLDLYRTHFHDSCLLRLNFGATEAHFACVQLVDKRAAAQLHPVPLGYPTGDAEILVLDPAGNLLPAGEIGELAVCRRYLTRGYWRNPSLTATRYTPDPRTPDDPTRRIYHTRDLGYAQPDGSFVFAGRADQQIKIRGRFANPADLEEALLGLPGIAQAAALVDERDPAHPTLIAYVAPTSGAQTNSVPTSGAQTNRAPTTSAQANDPSEITVSHLYRQLVTRVPEHLLPSTIAILDRLPLNAGGKIDRKALPPPGVQRPALDTLYSPPATPLEQLLAELWGEVLAVQPVGIHDHFLELGGDSLRAMILINRLRPLIDEYIPAVSVVLEAGTVAALARFLAVHYPTAAALHDPLPLVSTPVTPAVPTLEAALPVLHTWCAGLSTRAADEPAPAQRNPPALFILSPPRSGSTLLRVMLAGHPALFAPPELHLMDYRTLAERAALNQGDAQYRESLLQTLMGAYSCDLDAAEARLATLEAARLTVHDFYARLQAQLGPRLLVDKSPVYAYAPATLAAIERSFDAPRYLHLIRQPGAMIHSYRTAHAVISFLRRVQRRFPDDPRLAGLPATLPFPDDLIAEAIYLLCHTNILAHTQSLPPSRVLRVYYEELVTHPAETLHGVCAFLGIPYNPAMLDVYATGPTRMTGGIHALTRPAGDVNFADHTTIDPALAGAWRTHFDPARLAPATRDLAAQLGIRD